MNSSPRLIFFGTEDFSIPTLKALIDANYNIVSVVTKPDARKGRGKQVFVHPIKELAQTHNIPVLQPQKLRDIESELISLHPDAGILVSYGKLIPKRTIDLFGQVGIINLHPSRLPRYRGPSPIEATILSGDQETALSIMQLDEGMDTGPVYAQQVISLSGTETKPELSARLANKGATFLVGLLPDILSDTLKPHPQQNNDVSVTSLILKQDGILDPSTEDALTLGRKVRAYLGYPKTRLMVLNNDVIVTSATVVDDQASDGLIVTCANKTWLRIDTLIGPSGRTMSGTDFLRGYSKKT